MTASIRRQYHGEENDPSNSNRDHDEALEEIERYFESEPKPGIDSEKRRRINVSTGQHRRNFQKRLRVISAANGVYRMSL
jgi:antitoxin component HigA of HigAB toxin-antitoxin module